MNPYPFFEALASNNNREWFAAHRGEYDALLAEWKDGIERARAMVAAEVWPEVAHTSLKTFRIYRDTRFSLDKTPFKTHLGSVIAPPGGRDVHHPGVYVQVGIPDAETGVFGGVWAPESADLKKLRHAMVDNIEEWEEIVNDSRLTRYFPDWFGERLKTAPKGWPKDHPQIEYLRLKHIGRESIMSRDQFRSPHWPEMVAERVAAIVPLIRFLDYSLFEE